MTNSAGTCGKSCCLFRRVVPDCVFRRFRPLVPKEGARFFRRKAPYDSEGLRPLTPIDCAWVFRANRSVATRVFQLLSVL
jgi:hypothetical protein